MLDPITACTEIADYIIAFRAVRRKDMGVIFVRNDLLQEISKRSGHKYPCREAADKHVWLRYSKVSLDTDSTVLIK
ncbi:hypothetical protein J6590_007176 [Homalodisca vitripennis]|nr:hypothetical protein J6590_007176 [Homalodisca vitripennis]